MVRHAALYSSEDRGRRLLLHGDSRRPVERSPGTPYRSAAACIRRRSAALSIRNDSDLYPARPHACRLVIAARRCKLSLTLESDQEGLFTRPGFCGFALDQQVSETREGYLAAPLLGACHSRRRRPHAPHRLHPFQSSETWACVSRVRLAAFEFSPLRGARPFTSGLGWQRARLAGRCWRMIRRAAWWAKAPNAPCELGTLRNAPLPTLQSKGNTGGGA